MTDGVVAEALRAVRYVDTIMRRTADKEDLILPPDEPHQDWRPRYSRESDPTVYQWHPPYGETHVKYHVYRGGGGRNPIVWSANHHGINQGMETIQPPGGGLAGSITWPLYSNSYEPDQLGRFKTPEQAKAAAEEHYRHHYPKADYGSYDIDKIMGDHEPKPEPRRGLGDDEDYGHIFSMIRRALTLGKHGQRLAGDGMSWEDTMRYIDETLAEGEPGTGEGRHLPETDSLLYEDYHNGPVPEPVQHEVGQCRNCGNSVIKQLGTGRWLDRWHFSPACGTAGTHEVSDHPTSTH